MRAPKGGLDLGTAEIARTVGVNPAALDPAANLSRESPAPAQGPARSGQARKYGNRKVEVGGRTFDSEREAANWQKLSLMEQSGQIRNLEHHVAIPLVVNGVLVYTWTADFRYFVGDRLCLADAKSEPVRRKDTWRVVKKLVKALYNVEVIEL